MFTEFLSSPYFNLFSFLAGLFFSYLFFIKGIKKKRFTYSFHSINIAKKQQDIPNLKIVYYDDEVVNLTITKFYFWNSGKDIISKEDLIENSPLRICLKDPGNRIFDCSVVTTTNDYSNTSVTRMDNSSYQIRFDLLEYQDGAVIKIIHEGGIHSLCVKGKIKKIRNFHFNSIALFEPETKARLFGIIPIEFSTKLSRGERIQYARRLSILNSTLLFTFCLTTYILLKTGIIKHSDFFLI